MKGPDVLVTGATGFIGSHLVKKLVSEGREVAIISRSGRKGENLEDITDKKLSIIKADLLDEKSLEAKLYNFSEVYHLAGMVHTNRFYSDEIWKSNFLTTKNLFQVLAEKGVGRVVYLASIFSLGKGTKEKPADENTRYNIEYFARRIPYFKAKYEAQKMVEQFLDKGMDITFVYPCFCLGPGDIYLSSSKMLYLFLKGLVRLWWDGGINVMDVRDAADGLVLGMKKGKRGEKYIIGGENIEFKKLFKVFADISGLPEPFIKIPSFAIRAAGNVLEKLLSKNAPIDRGSALISTDYWFYSYEKARKELGYSARPLRETVRDAVEWFRQNESKLKKR